MSFIHSITAGVPDYIHSQVEFYERVAPKINPALRSIFKKIIDGSLIRKRHAILPIEEIIRLTNEKEVGEKFKLWKEITTEFFTKQSEQILKEAGLNPSEIDGIATCTTSGFVTPFIDVLVQNNLNLKSDIIRMPLISIGCSGGMATINRVREYLIGSPEKAFLVCVGEVLSTQYENAEEAYTLVSNSIFGDGFATLLMVGKDHHLAKTSQVELLNSKSHLFKDSNFSVAQSMTNGGLHTYIDPNLPNLVKEHFNTPIAKMFEEMMMKIEDVEYFIMHAGGPKVVTAIGEALGIEDEKLELTLETYRNFGNQSSVSVLTALATALQTYKKPGLAFMSGLGPGVHLEYCLCNITPTSPKINND